MDQIVKKKRGRRPKSFYDCNIITEIADEQEITEKKKRGRKKKYEIQNSEKINTQ